ncbi:hypothetical protein ABW21_db0209520 [Orbilia brochopaga]|nr:hypothetical protein ABW21_db0209520 [Drechslerella brochopaga]
MDTAKGIEIEEIGTVLRGQTTTPPGTVNVLNTVESDESAETVETVEIETTGAIDADPAHPIPLVRIEPPLELRLPPPPPPLRTTTTVVEIFAIESESESTPVAREI